MAKELPNLIAQTMLHQSANLLKAIARRYAAAPLASTGIVLMTCFGAMAVNNALFTQTSTHPAPLFFEQSTTRHSVNPVPQVAPTPAPRPEVQEIIAQPVPVVEVPVQQLTAQPVSSEGDTVTNAQLAQAQQRLKAMGLFAEDVDGFYGPKTAEAIRAFELRNGLPPKGALDPQVINLILRASSIPSADRPQSSASTSVQTVQPQMQMVEETPIAQQPETVVAQPESASQTSIQTGSGQDALAALLGSNEVQGATPRTVPIVETQAEPTEIVRVEQMATNTAPIEESVNLAAPVASDHVVTDKVYIEKVQRALASLAFLHGPIDGIAGESTARAIRSFEVFNNYEVTGRITPELLDLLLEANALVN